MNVGCVPKKICHYGALLGQAMKDARKLGWKLPGDKEVEVRAWNVRFACGGGGLWGV